MFIDYFLRGIASGGPANPIASQDENNPSEWNGTLSKFWNRPTFGPRITGYRNQTKRDIAANFRGPVTLQKEEQRAATWTHSYRAVGASKSPNTTTIGKATYLPGVGLNVKNQKQRPTRGQASR